MGIGSKKLTYYNAKNNINLLREKIGTDSIRITALDNLSDLNERMGYKPEKEEEE